jgi:hypothetical protein
VALPPPKLLTFKPGLVEDRINAWGVTSTDYDVVAIDTSRDSVKIAGTIVHEYMHLAGWSGSDEDHAYIRVRQDAFTNWLYSQGFQ